MSSFAGRQLGVSARSLYKLHNLSIPVRWTFTASLIAGDNTGDILHDFNTGSVQKTDQWQKQTPLVAERGRDSADSTATTNRFFQQEYTFKMTHSTENESLQLSPRTGECIDEKVLTALTKGKHDLVVKLLQTVNTVSENALLKLFAAYSNDGSIETVLFLQNYSEIHYPHVYAGNANFSHFVAKAHCLRGNSENGLSLLTEAYNDNVKFRRTYCTLFRDLIHDSVTNRSVASLVIFKSYVVRWSERWSEHYPLVCLWHACWCSSWFSDHTLAEELVDAHESLRDVIQDRAKVLSWTSLANSNDDDAVIRLLQTLLKYKMMDSYVQVLEILFHFRLKNQDTRGCTEIVRNSKDLGLTLSQRIQDKYIHMVINRDARILPQTSPKPTDNFKFKF